MIQQCVSAAQFLEQRPDLPEAGQWAELVQGTIVLSQPPDLDHGTVVLNLSKQLAAHFSQGGAGYACFDLGLQLATGPDTVLFPAVSLYLSGPRFAQSDKEVTAVMPELVVEILSTSERRQRSAEKVQLYLAWGVQSVWLIHSSTEAVSLHSAHAEPRRLTAANLLQDPLLPGFSMPVQELFAEPEWYRSNRK